MYICYGSIVKREGGRERKEERCGIVKREGGREGEVWGSKERGREKEVLYTFDTPCEFEWLLKNRMSHNYNV